MTVRKLRKSLMKKQMQTNSKSPKGQIMSDCIYEIINFPKYHRKNLIDICLGRLYRLGTWDLFWLFSRQLYLGECITYLVWIIFQGRHLSNFFGGILENWWFHKYIDSDFIWPLQIKLPYSKKIKRKVARRCPNMFRFNVSLGFVERADKKN